MTNRFKVGANFPPQATTVPALRAVWKEADALGVDSIWTWDHFFPLFGDPDATHFECWSLLAAMAVETEHAQFGALVTCQSYRNPDLLADMARTIDHLSGGRLILGLGAGWFERDYDEYGYEFGDAPSRLRGLRETLERVKARLPKLNPPPVGPLPILVGGGGEKVTLRLVAEHADMWNIIGSPEEIARKSAILDDWCAKVGRDPASIERTVMSMGVPDEATLEGYLGAGISHVIVAVNPPFDLAPVEELLALAKS